MKRFFFVLMSLVFILMGSWYFVVPEALVVNLIENFLDKHNVHLEIEGFRKGFFYNFKAERIVLMAKKPNEGSEPFLVLDNVKAGVDLESLFTLSPQIELSCIAYEGFMLGTVRLFGQERISFHGSNSRIKGIHLLTRLGFAADGLIDWNMHLGEENGEIKFSIREANLKNLLPVFPLELFNLVNCAMEIHNNMLSITSCTLEGSDLYARLRGKVTATNLNLMAELMTGPEFKWPNQISMFVEKFKVSPGYYVMPVQHSLTRGF